MSSVAVLLVLMSASSGKLGVRWGKALQDVSASLSEAYWPLLNFLRNLKNQIPYNSLTVLRGEVGGWNWSSVLDISVGRKLVQWYLFPPSSDGYWVQFPSRRLRDCGTTAKPWFPWTMRTEQWAHWLFFPLRKSHEVGACLYIPRRLRQMHRKGRKSRSLDVDHFVFSSNPGIMNQSVEKFALTTKSRRFLFWSLGGCVCVCVWLGEVVCVFGRIGFTEGRKQRVDFHQHKKFEFRFINILKIFLTENQHLCGLPAATAKQETTWRLFVYNDHFRLWNQIHRN